MNAIARLAAAAALALPGVAQAVEWDALIVEHVIEAPYEDVLEDLRLTIEGRGFVIDAVSHVGAMLNRTAGDVGAQRQVYDHAEVTQFCSATLSRKVMEADARNLAFCPYGIFTYQLHGEAGRVHVGYRRMPDGPMQEIEALLDSIVRETVGLD